MRGVNVRGWAAADIMALALAHGSSSGLMVLLWRELLWSLVGYFAGHSGAPKVIRVSLQHAIALRRSMVHEP